MKKYILGFVLVGLLAVGIYYGRYFIFDTKVNEEAPTLVTESKEKTTTLEGGFTEVDRIHKGSGKAILVSRGNEKVLRFEDFQVTNGPDLYV